MCASTWAAKSSGLQSRSGTTSVRSSPWWTVCPETEPTLSAMVDPLLRLLLWRESSTGDVEGSGRAVAILFSVRVKLVGSRTASCKPRRGFGRTGRDVKVLSKCGGAPKDTRPLGRCCSSWAEGRHEAKSRGLVVWREKVGKSQPQPPRYGIATRLSLSDYAPCKPQDIPRLHILNSYLFVV